MFKCVITGGAGFIGQKLSLKLIELGHEVVIIDNLSPQIHGENSYFSPPPGAEFLKVDVRNSDAYQIHIDSADVIFHLAAETGTAQSMYEIHKYTSVNVGGTASLLEALAKSTRKHRKVICASSRSVYGEGMYIRETDSKLSIPTVRKVSQLKGGDWSVYDLNGVKLISIPTNENFLPMPASVYAATKLAQENLLTSSSENLGFQLINFRFQNVYGEGQSLKNPYTGLLSIFLNMARQGINLPLYEDGCPVRDFIHIDDICHGLILGMNYDNNYPLTLNLGSGVPTSIQMAANMLIEKGGFDVKTKITADFRAGDIRSCFADISLAESTIGFTPLIDFPTGVGRLIEWGLTQPIYQDKSNVALQEQYVKMGIK